MGCHFGGRICSSLEVVPGVRDAGGVDYGRVYNLGSGEAVCKEGGSVGMEYSMGRMGTEDLGRKTRLLAVMVSACRLIIGLLLRDSSYSFFSSPYVRCLITHP
jgi:hypothetical protein